MQRRIIDYMAKHRIHVLALSETMVSQTTQFMSGDYTFFLFGSGAKREYAGVGFVVHNTIKHTITGFASWSSRVALIGLHLGGRPLLLGSAYTPQSGRPYEERAHFFSDLERANDQFRSKG
eukprot:6358745-Alexandrium_andersonii.AAC.1